MVIAWSESIAERKDASYETVPGQCPPSPFGRNIRGCAHLAVRELVQESALVDMLGMQDDVPVPAAAGGSNNVLVERERGEDDDCEQVDDSADGAGAFWDLPPIGLGHVDALEPSLDEGRPQPADHGVGSGVGHAAQGERCDQGLALAAEGVCQDGAACRGQGGEADRLGAGELGCCCRHGCGVRELRFEGRPIAQYREESLAKSVVGVVKSERRDTIDGDGVWSFVPAPGPKKATSPKAQGDAARWSFPAWTPPSPESSWGSLGQLGQPIGALK